MILCLVTVKVEFVSMERLVPRDINEKLDRIPSSCIYIHVVLMVHVVKGRQHSTIHIDAADLFRVSCFDRNLSIGDGRMF